jgi:hypothetical protein
MGELSEVNKSKLGLVNGAIGIVTNPKPSIEPETLLDEEVLDI